MPKLKAAHLKRIGKLVLEQVKGNRLDGCEVMVYTYQGEEDDDAWFDVEVSIGNAETRFDNALDAHTLDTKCETENQMNANADQLLAYLQTQWSAVFADYHAAILPSVAHQTN